MHDEPIPPPAPSLGSRLVAPEGGHPAYRSPSGSRVRPGRPKLQQSDPASRAAVLDRVAVRTRAMDRRSGVSLARRVAAGRSRLRPGVHRHDERSPRAFRVQLEAWIAVRGWGLERISSVCLVFRWRQLALCAAVGRHPTASGCVCRKMAHAGQQPIVCAWQVPCGSWAQLFVHGGGAGAGRRRAGLRGAIASLDTGDHWSADLNCFT
jgi:hypothetical protein